MCSLKCVIGVRIVNSSQLTTNKYSFISVIIYIHWFLATSDDFYHQLLKFDWSSEC